MKRNPFTTLFLFMISMIFFCSHLFPLNCFTEDTIQLIVRGDDMGSSHTANVACIRAYQEGIVRSVEVMVPTPWFNEAAAMLAEVPELDVGIHLTLTSEWELCKWGPVTQAPSLVDRMGRFFPMVWPNRNYPNASLHESKPLPQEVENELRTQIQIAMEKIPRISHLSDHMAAAQSTPEFQEILERLSREFNLPLDPVGIKPAGGLGGSHATPEQKEGALIEILKKLKPGLWLLVDHPGLDTPELRSQWHKGYETVAQDRAGVTFAFTSPKVKKLIQERGIEMISYKQAHQ